MVAASKFATSQVGFKGNRGGEPFPMKIYEKGKSRHNLINICFKFEKSLPIPKTCLLQVKESICVMKYELTLVAIEIDLGSFKK